MNVYLDAALVAWETAAAMKIRRITANLPEALLKDAQRSCGLGITETLILGLEALMKKSSLQKAQSLRGKITLAADKGRVR